jgi:hypothetical protein
LVVDGIVVGFTDPLILGCLCGGSAYLSEVGVGMPRAEVEVGSVTGAVKSEAILTVLVGGDADCEAGGVDRLHDEDGMIGSGGLSFETRGLGGHSRFSFASSFASSFAESPVVCDATLELRGEAATD